MPSQADHADKPSKRTLANRENAKKSTGPKSESGKATVSMNALKNGTRTRVIDESTRVGLALVTGEAIADYKTLHSDYMKHYAPSNRLERVIVQRIIDTQWRLFRNSTVQTLEFETALDTVRTIEHPGVGDSKVAAIDLVAASRITADSKYLVRLQREEAALVRLINASLRELNLARKLNPTPPPPVRSHIEVHSPEIGPLDLIDRDSAAQLAAKKATSQPAAHDQSQPEATCQPLPVRPVEPNTEVSPEPFTPLSLNVRVAHAGGAFHVDLDPV